MDWWIAGSCGKEAPNNVGTVRVFGGRIAEVTAAKGLETDLTGQKSVNVG